MATMTLRSTRLIWPLRRRDREGTALLPLKTEPTRSSASAEAAMAKLPATDRPTPCTRRRGEISRERTRYPPTWNRFRNPMHLTHGLTPANTATIVRAPRNISLLMSLATKTSMTTGTGVTMEVTAMSGIPVWKLGGRRITQAIGLGSIPGDTRGWMTHRGATHPSITDAG